MPRKPDTAESDSANREDKPDWKRFERTVDRMLHTKPKPHAKSPEGKNPKKAPKP
jgi:hypothetical protein